MPFLTIQGINIHYRNNRQFLPEQPAIIFVHGAGGNGRNWLYQLAGIDGYNLIALDLPGHGRSEGSASDLISVYSEFVWNFAQALGISQFVLAGHSMGGAIALEFASAYPNVLKGLIIVDSGARLRVDPSTLEILSRGEHPVGNVKYFYSTKVSDTLLEQAIEEMKTVPPEVYLADFTACNGFNIMDRLKGINLPTLIICGEDDQMTPVKYSQYLADELRQSSVSIIKDAGHMAMLEQPDSVNKAIRDFMDAMLKTIGAYINVPLSDYDEGMLFHVVELMKDSLREQTIEIILEDSWEVGESQRKLYKNEDGFWEHSEDIDDAREMLEVMTVNLTVKLR